MSYSGHRFACMIKTSANISEVSKGIFRRIKGLTDTGRKSGIFAIMTKGQIANVLKPRNIPLKGAGAAASPLLQNTAKQLGERYSKRIAPGMIFAGKDLQSGIEGLSGPGKKAARTMGILHELYERGAGPSQLYKTRQLHASPQVLMKEHNLLSTIKGKGARNASDAIIGARQSIGEASAFSRSLEDISPKFRDYIGEYGRGQKMPRAMRKYLTKKLLAQDRQFYQAMSGFMHG